MQIESWGSSTGKLNDMSIIDDQMNRFHTLERQYNNITQSLRAEALGLKCLSLTTVDFLRGSERVEEKRDIEREKKHPLPACISPTGD